MYELTEADMIWNRACGLDPLRALPGDRALADLLLLHNHAMNSGLLDAVESLTADELASVQAGYRFFSFDDVVSLLQHARSVFEASDDPGSHERRLDQQYWDLIPEDSFIVGRFEERLKLSPSEFAPLRANDKASD